MSEFNVVTFFKETFEDIKNNSTHFLILAVSFILIYHALAFALANNMADPNPVLIALVFVMFFAFFYVYLKTAIVLRNKEKISLRTFWAPREMLTIFLIIFTFAILSNVLNYVLVVLSSLVNIAYISQAAGFNVAELIRFIFSLFLMSLLAFSVFLVIDEKSTFFASIRQSIALSKGNRFNVIVVLIVLLILNTFAVYVYVSGLVITLPLTFGFLTSVYRFLISRELPQSYSPMTPMKTGEDKKS